MRWKNKTIHTLSSNPVQETYYVKEYQFVVYITVQFNKNAFKNHKKWKVKKQISL